MDDINILHPHTEFILPSTDNPTVAFTVQEFGDILREDWMARFQRLPPCVPAARIRYIELRRYDSWKEWKHEFVVVRIELDDTEYDVQFDRAWDTQGRYGWREYVPLPGMGSRKTAANEVTLTLASGWASDIKLKARFTFHDNPIAILSELVLVLPDESTKIVRYSLFGVNCWAWSRRFFLLSVFNMSEKICGARLAEKGQEVDVVKVIALLDTGKWMRVADHAFGGNWLDTLDEVRSLQIAPGTDVFIFRTRSVVLYGSEVTDWFSGEIISELSSHSYRWLSPSLAWVSGNSSDEFDWKSFNTPNELLYLMTAPIHTRIHSFGVMQSSLWMAETQGTLELVEAPGGCNFSIGIIRQSHDSVSSCPLRIDCPVGEGRGWFSGQDHPLLEAFLVGDRLAVWVKTYPTICRILVRASISYRVAHASA